jgi:hypothetical protein
MAVYRKLWFFHILLISFSSFPCKSTTTGLHTWKIQQLITIHSLGKFNSLLKLKIDFISYSKRCGRRHLIDCNTGVSIILTGSGAGGAAQNSNPNTVCVSKTQTRQHSLA